VRELNLYFQWRAFCEVRILIILSNSSLFDKKVPTDLHLSGLLRVYRRSVDWYGQIVFLLIHAIQTLAPCWPLKRSSLILWLNQRHALKVFRVSVGDEEGHETDGILAQEGVQPDKSLHNQFLPHPVSVDAS